MGKRGPKTKRRIHAIGQKLKSGKVVYELALTVKGPGARARIHRAARSAGVQARTTSWGPFIVGKRKR